MYSHIYKLYGLLVIILIQVLSLRAYAEPLAFRQANLQRMWAEQLMSSGLTENSLKRTTISKPLTANQLATPHYFQQRVDHSIAVDLNTTDDKKFAQKFYINGEEYEPGGPIYLFNSGETPASSSYLTAGEPYQLAKETRGMVIVMEHRYYGESYPVPDLSGKNMIYLTIENALEDIRFFIQNSQDLIRSATGHEIEGSKWIVVGGSYSANLAVWARSKYPDIVYAAYSSSAPLQAYYDFYQYDQVVNEALPCADKIADAIETLDHILDSKNRTLIEMWKKEFGLKDINDDHDFAGALIDQVSNTVQYYLPPSNPGHQDTIEALCKWFNRDDRIPLQNFADMTRAYIKSNDIDPVSSYGSLAGSDNISLYQDGRAWFWQTCTQFGYWQSAPQPPLRRLRSKYVTADWQMKPCKSFFGEGIPDRPDIDRINRMYGGWFPDVTRVVFVNGMLDPWSRLSVIANTNSSQAQIIQGKNAIITMRRASHVVDFYVSNGRTDFGVDVARKHILEAIKSFLDE